MGSGCLIRQTFKSRKIETIFLFEQQCQHELRNPWYTPFISVGCFIMNSRGGHIDPPNLTWAHSPSEGETLPAPMQTANHKGVREEL